MGRKILYLGLDPSHYQTDGEIIHCPLIQIVPRPIQDPSIQAALQLFNRYTHLVFTSKSAVHILKDYLIQLGWSWNDWIQKIHIAVGKSTARALQAYGIHPAMIAKEETAEGIVAELSSWRLDDAFFLWPHSALSRPLLAEFFHANGIRFMECLLYDTHPLIPQERPCLDHFDEIVFTSPSTVEAFLQVFGSLPQNKLLTSIGPITQGKLQATMLNQL